MKIMSPPQIAKGQDVPVRIGRWENDLVTIECDIDGKVHDRMKMGILVRMRAPAGHPTARGPVE